MDPRWSLIPRRLGRGHGFTLPELLVVVGIIALLMSLLLTPLQRAHRQAKVAVCAAQLQQIGQCLQDAYTEFRYFPVWDDEGTPRRFTWVDVLVQRRLLDNRRVAYCPEDPRPGELNSARGAFYLVNYPDRPGSFGVDYSYGIAVPLSAGGWNWRPAFAPNEDPRSRRLKDVERYPAQRVLAGDGGWTMIYNLSGDMLHGSDWSFPTQYDNTVDWRHLDHGANLLYQDGHVALSRYALASANPIDTMQSFLWYPGETLNITPETRYQAQWYPNTPPIDLVTGEGDGTYPRELAPGYYTHNRLWTIDKYAVR
jgi:prepilin-type N-terminal cleavage/methylation domain-containing protein/prepilin-type processing-associated H-X9-DG protein